MSAQHTQGRLTVAGPTIQGSEDACGVPLALAHMLNPYAGAAGAADRVEANARRLNDRQPWTWLLVLIWFLFCAIGTNYLIALFY